MGLTLAARRAITKAQLAKWPKATKVETTDLLTLRHQIADIQGNLIELARRRGQIQQRAKTNAIYLSRRKMSPPKRAKPGESTTHPSRAS